MNKEYKYIINGNKYEVAVANVEENIATVLVNGEEYKVEMEKEAEPEKKKVVRPVVAPVAKPVDEAADKAKAVAQNSVKAPLPGVIIDIKVAVGDTVEVGDTVAVLEAMKMENNLETEKAGTVTDILVQVGESVMEMTPLVVIE